LIRSVPLKLKLNINDRTFYAILIINTVLHLGKSEMKSWLDPLSVILGKLFDKFVPKKLMQVVFILLVKPFVLVRES